jgi:hypothetical protein
MQRARFGEPFRIVGRKGQQDAVLRLWSHRVGVPAIGEPFNPVSIAELQALTLEHSSGFRQTSDFFSRDDSDCVVSLLDSKFDRRG